VQTGFSDLLDVRDLAPEAREMADQFVIGGLKLTAKWMQRSK
jgi:hypothetical protein